MGCLFRAALFVVGYSENGTVTEYLMIQAQISKKGC